MMVSEAPTSIRAMFNYEAFIFKQVAKAPFQPSSVATSARVDRGRRFLSSSRQSPRPSNDLRLTRRSLRATSPSRMTPNFDRRKPEGWR
jgi:hypothetical protein